MACRRVPSYTTAPLPTLQDLWILPLTVSRKPYSFRQTSAAEGRGQFSPDGQWIAYESSEGAGHNEVVVVPFPGPGGTWQVSTTGGLYPRWRRDGKEIFFISHRCEQTDSRSGQCAGRSRRGRSGDAVVRLATPAQRRGMGIRRLARRAALSHHCKRSSGVSANQSRRQLDRRVEAG